LKRSFSSSICSKSISGFDGLMPDCSTRVPVRKGVLERIAWIASLKWEIVSGAHLRTKTGHLHIVKAS
jgi:hypothetical protein